MHEDEPERMFEPSIQSPVIIWPTRIPQRWLGLLIHGGELSDDTIPILCRRGRMEAIDVGRA